MLNPLETLYNKITKSEVPDDSASDDVVDDFEFIDCSQLVESATHTDSSEL